MIKRYKKLILPSFLTLLVIWLGFSDSLGSRWLSQFPFLTPEVYQVSLIILMTWILIVLIHFGKRRILRNYDLSGEDNLVSRKKHKLINLLEKVLVFAIVLTSVGLIFMTFDSIREIGVGIFTSVGVLGIIVGLSAQKIVGALLAGIQIAITQPFRIEDAVVVENEWGWIEEISLTFIVVRLWDKRRLVLPTTYFIEKPFQNWTRTTADILGSVFLYTDYKVPLDALRTELTRLLESSPLWDKKVNVLQVTDAKETTQEIRMLVSARNSPTAWDLRVFIREKMIEFLQRNYPESLPQTRIILHSAGTEKKIKSPDNSFIFNGLPEEKLRSKRQTFAFRSFCITSRILWNSNETTQASLVPTSAGSQFPACFAMAFLFHR